MERAERKADWVSYTMDVREFMDKLGITERLIMVSYTGGKVEIFTAS